MCEGLRLGSVWLQLSWVPYPFLSLQDPSHRDPKPCLTDLASFPEAQTGGTHAVFDLRFSDKQRCLSFYPHELDPKGRQEVVSLVAVGTASAEAGITQDGHLLPHPRTLSRRDTR